MKTKCACHVAGLLAGFFVQSSPLRADGYLVRGDVSPDNAVEHWAAGKYALGDFGTLRDDLEKKGVDFFGYYTADIASNPVGGTNPGNTTYTDDIYFGVNLYLAKLLGWNGTRVFINGIRRDGKSLTGKYVGSIYNSQQDYGGENIFLYDVDVEQLLFNEKVSIKLGRFSASDDFNNSPIYNLYMNNGIDGDIRNVLFDTQFSAYPFSTWAGRISYFPAKEVEMKFGVFQTSKDVFNRERNGVDWSIDPDDGVFLIGQVNWSPEFNKQPVARNTGKPDGKATADSGETETKGLKGHYNIGGSYSPWKGFSRFDNGRQRAGSWGVFAHADQMVYQAKPGANQGLVLWAAGAAYPQGDISIVPYQAEGGLVYQGLVPRRPEDKTLLGVVYGKFSQDFARQVEAAGNGHPDYELVLEGAYRFQFTKFFFVQPDIQFINKPFGTGRIDDVLVVGTHSGIVF